MESFLSLFIFQGSYVVSALVLAITIIVVILLLFNQKSPDSVVRSEMGDTDQVESALRRVLGEQRRTGAAEVSSGGTERLSELEKEVLAKDRAIADLNKQLTQSGGSAGASGEDQSELLEKIANLESRLQEYEIIEDDIADLSLYRTENEKLKEELARLKALAGDAEASAEEPPPPAISDVEPPEVTEPTPMPPAKKEVSGTDLVAEFEKVVNNQDHISDDSTDGQDVVEDSPDRRDGQVVMAGSEKKNQDSGQPDPEEAEQVHEELKNVAPDSKEEAEVFIANLNSLKKVSE